MTADEALRLRTDLLASADVDRAVLAAQILVGSIGEHLDALQLDFATALVARALVARGMRALAASLAADHARLSDALALAIIAGIIDEPPAAIAAAGWTDPTIAGRG